METTNKNSGVQKVTRFDDGTIFVVEQTDDLLTETYYKTTAPQNLSSEPTNSALCSIFADRKHKTRRHNLRLPALILIQLLYTMAIICWATIPLQYADLHPNRSTLWEQTCSVNITK
ncbi:hypothetical protein [Vombatid gammaherpesvirus 1]|uniref:Uncharacterized protein n=1 Tax=Vombatid gammaherpesvirus 1 TaxID=2052651 RepID=A0A3S8D7N6_9GAMA|nr:hypothetical protein KM710_gp21 [Vombatid gammaherpesvirus 1]AZB49126.1 hypothetical protein [Vombatid gammaherpesvirus 1]